MKRVLVKLLDDLSIGYDKKIYEKLSKYEYISFDIFDTLIKRDVSRPSEVFKVIEKKYEISGFYKARIEAERKARENSDKEDVYLEEIYDCLDIDYNKKKLMQIEKETEFSLCTANKEIQPIFEWCRNNNKKIIIASDMYLDKETIDSILKNNGFSEYYKLYVSNDVMKTKHSGSLYRYIIGDLKIDNKKIIHIGNSFKADYYKAKKSGIAAIKIRTT